MPPATLLKSENAILVDRFRDGRAGTAPGAGVPGIFTVLTLSGLSVYLALGALAAGCRSGGR